MKTYHFSGRIAVIGMGAVTPLGNIGPNDEGLWEALKEGRTAFKPFPFDYNPSKILARVASDMRDFDYMSYFAQLPKQTDRPRPVKVDPAIQIATAATLLAIQSSGLELSARRKPGIGVVAGSGLGGGRSWELGFTDFLEDRYNPLVSTVVNVMNNATAGYISNVMGFGGPSFGTTGACASSKIATAVLSDLIRLGRIKVGVAVGTETSATKFQHACFDKIKALSRQGISVPFSPDRDGFVMGEAAGAIILEDWDSAKAHGHTILAEILGYALNSGASDMYNPNAEGAAECMELALEDAEVPTTLIDYINSHGTSTPDGDVAEAYAIWKVFCANQPFFQPPKLPYINSSKALLGHTLGAAGVLGLITSILSLRDGIIHPMGHYEVDPQCLRPEHLKDEVDPFNQALPIVTERIETPLAVAMSNAFGFGDHNASIIVARPDFQQ